MRIGQDFKCMIGCHKYQVYEKLTINDIRGNAVGIVITSRCTYCGKLKAFVLRTVQY